MGPRLRGDDSGKVEQDVDARHKAGHDEGSCFRGHKAGHDERAHFRVDDGLIPVEPALFHRNFRSPWFQPIGTAALAEGCPMG
jgi:hypothetical protein